MKDQFRFLIFDKDTLWANCFNHIKKIILKKNCEIKDSYIVNVNTGIRAPLSGLTPKAVVAAGGTGFDSIEGRQEPLIVDPVKGRMVVFQNVHEDGSRHKQSRHAGLPVISGEKWAFNLWVREK